jgi:hypothetical protein
MNMEFGTVTPQFRFWEYLFQIFGTGPLQCMVWKLLNRARILNF